MVSSPLFKSILVSLALSVGTNAACTRFIEAHAGDTCAILASAAGINVAQFLQSNPSVTSCNQLTNGAFYCIEGVADSAPQASTTSTARPAQPSQQFISTDGTCGNGVTCSGSRYGNCCSQFGFCGSNSDYCLSDGCQPAFGLCGAGAMVSSSHSIVTATPGPTITPPPGSTVTVTVTAVGAVTRTSLVYETRTTTTAATVLTTQTVRVTAATTVTNTVAQSVAVTATATATVTSIAITTRTIQTIATVTSTVAQTIPQTVTNTVRTTVVATATSTAVTTRTATIPATSYDIVTLTTIETRVITATSTTLRTSTTTTTTTRVVQTVIPVTETLTSIVTSISTRFVTAVTGACSTVPPRPSIVTTTLPGGGRPTPLLPGTPSNCRNFAVIREEDTCRTIAQRNSLTLLQFYDLNPSVGNDGDILGLLCTLELLLSGLCQINCDQLWEGYYVCVGK
ncbi:hypothetical protein QBC35DRAFT_546938 [Podospora australis]|uniref:Carbohydrate-binding module family 18 protein n=1 Tax=Podospora australis TaxID=1536484 RepID=A0AAN6WLG9_9PEZI|nr:hypothetical protein QBC35DRAFT_546938 [Podospora australis]